MSATACAAQQSVPASRPLLPPPAERSAVAFGANFYPDPPAHQENGQQFAAPTDPSSLFTTPASSAQVTASAAVTAQHCQGNDAEQPTDLCPFSIHDGPTLGQKIAQEKAAAADTDSADPLTELLTRALSRPRRGRPAVFDEHNKGKLVALLSLGMSLRQAAAVLGVSHGTIRNTLKADPALAEEINAARFQAQLQPLACVIREARRSWKAATWLLKYLDAKIASHDETPDERRHRLQRERDELLGRV